MFLPIGDIYRGDRIVATVSDDGALTFKTLNRADALAVIAGVISRCREWYIDVAVDQIKQEILRLEQQ